jgi:hypothetical protein
MNSFEDLIVVENFTAKERKFSLTFTTLICTPN